MGLKSVIMELMYGFATCYACKGNAWVNRFRHRSKAIIFRMADFASRMALCDGQIRTVVPETAYEEKVEEREFPGSAGPLRVMMLGRLLPHKGVLLALDAFAKYLNMGGDGNLIVCGTGSVKRDMEKRIRTLGIYNRVQMMGQCSHDRVLKLMDEYDVMLHLSFREGGAWSILECMAHGMPIICQGKSGMNDMVANDCGTKISASTPDDLIGQAADALLRYGTNPELLAEQGRKGQERVRKVYRWSKIADQIDEVYKKVVNC
jgi:glycosyltransferase involved in cell wall biosynthesis